MFTVSGRVYPSAEIDMPRNDRPLMVGGCGHFVLSAEEHKEISRPAGRRDYQMLYVRSGKAYYTLLGQEKAVSAGHIVFYYPGEPQFYHYLPGDQADIYWIHFTGHSVTNELDRLNLYGQRILTVTTRDAYSRLFDSVIQELQLKRLHYNDVADALFKELLCYISREVSVQTGIAVPRTREVEQAVRIFHTQFDKPFHLAEYAQSCNRSTCRFSRLFRRQMGVSPQQYLTEVRLSHACELLDSGSSVAEAGMNVGYEDPSYFSRIFKKHIGIPPAQYRSEHH